MNYCELFLCRNRKIGLKDRVGIRKEKVETGGPESRDNKLEDEDIRM